MTTRIAIIISARPVSSDDYVVELNVISALLLPLKDAAMVLTYTMLLFDVGVGMGDDICVEHCRN
eukprot:scaffold20658_cov99-Skeletonema_dohrnii-CCMP3373.AAC.1